jgi:hypothetical protein
MPFSAGASAGGGENVNHYAGIRVRVTGNCNLIPTYLSLDDVKTKTLVSIVVGANTGKEPFQLGGFVSQRAYLTLETQKVGEVFRINRVVIFAKPLWTGYSG